MNVKTILIIVLSFVTSRYVLALLGVDGYGLYYLVAGITATFDFFCSSMTGTTSRYTTLAEGKKDLEHSNMMFNTIRSNNDRLIYIIIGAIELFGVIMFLWVLKIPKDQIMMAVVIFQMMVIDTFFKFKIIPYNALLIAKENFLFPNLILIAQSVLKLALVFLLFLVSDQYRLIGYSLSVLLLSIIARSYTKTYVSKRFKESAICNEKVNNELKKEVFSFMKYSWVGQLGSVIKTQGTNFVLNIMTGMTTINAAYGVSRQISSVSDMAFTPISQTILPQTIKSYSSNEISRFRTLTLFNSKLSICLSWVVIIPLFVCVDFVFGLWLKETPDFAVQITKLILLSEMVRQMYNGLSMSCVVSDKIKKIYTLQPIIQSIAFIVAVVIMILDKSKLMTMFYVDIAVNVFYLLIYVIFSEKYIGISKRFYLLRIVLVSTAIGISCIVLFRLFYNTINNNSFYIILSIVACVTVVAVCLYLFLFNSEERKRMVSIIHSLVNKVLRK